VDAGSRQVIIAANWKMYKNKAQTQEFCRRLLPLLEDSKAKKLPETVIFPPAVLIDSLKEELKNSPINVGIQNIHWSKEGAYTGEISALMAADAGCKYCLCGHSERRHYFEESSEVVNRKASAALAAGLHPVVCIGETLEDRQNEMTMDVLRADLLSSLWGISNPGSKIVVAYEPVWAIGTGIVASPKDAEEAIAYIRTVLAEIWGETVAAQISILYGGSVKPDNIKEILACPNIDGVLVGGASLNPDSFAELVEAGR